MGHGKADCKFKRAECRTCGKKGHSSNACRHNTHNGEGKGKGKTKNLSHSMYRGNKGESEKACLRRGKADPAKANCKFKDEKCSNCGKTGHLKAVCRAKGANQVEVAGEADDGEKSIHVVTSWAMAVAQTGHDENGTMCTCGTRPPRRRMMCQCLNFNPETRRSCVYWADPGQILCYNFRLGICRCRRNGCRSANDAVSVGMQTR